MYFTGIDMGSTCTKLIVLDEGGAIAYKKVVTTGWNCVETAKGLIDELAKEGFARENMLIVSTGYGRQAIPFADKKVTEISCHGRGAYYLFNDDAFTLIDIGGQDTKIIEAERGTVRNFIMNDKCSAGTGRFLEIMAGVLGVGLNEMCELGRDVLESRDMQALRTFHQHGVISRYEHCLSVCYIALRLADKWHVDVDRRSMVRGALLHDFFMYNWNDPASMRPLHGFTHAREALSNAQKQFELNEIERDVIKKHMFPLNIALPRYRETALVSAADKISAVLELVHSARALRILRRCRAVGL